MYKNLIKTALMVFVITIALFSVTGCGNNKDAMRFKEEYEALNGVVDDSGMEYRTVSIDKKNPFVYATAEEIVRKIEDKETFFVYFGDAKCPWCRSVIEQAIEVAKENDVDKIYYVPIWDEDGNEILRDKYVLQEDGSVELVTQGTTAYRQLQILLENVLNDYSLTDKHGNKMMLGENRITAPNFIFIQNGEDVKLVKGISENQVESYDELTKEILKDQHKIFDGFFKEKLFY